MLWAIFPIFANFFYVSGSYLENYLTDIALPKKRAGALILGRLPSFVITMLILLAIFGRAVFILPFFNACGLILAGAINVVGSIYYFKALQTGDAADVNIFGQLSPLISLALGVAILGESVTTMQGIGLAIIMAAILIIVFGSTSKKERSAPNLTVARLTITSAFFSILSDVVYAYFVKGFTADVSLFGRGLFFFEIGSALAVILLFICRHSWRKALKTTFVTGKSHTRNMAALVGDNIAFTAGEFLYKYGLLVVPVIAMMTAVSKVSGLFISFFIFTLLLGRVFPKFIHGKRITHKILAQYLIAAVLIVVGIVVMN